MLNISQLSNYNRSSGHRTGANHLVHTPFVELEPMADRIKGHVVAVLPRGEAIRNFAQTGALDLVRERAELTVLSVVPDSASINALSARYQRVLPLRSNDERYPVRILRDLLDMAHSRCLWSPASQERWRLRDVEANTLSKRLKRWGKNSPAFHSRAGRDSESWSAPRDGQAASFARRITTRSCTASYVLRSYSTARTFTVRLQSRPYRRRNGSGYRPRPSSSRGII